MDLLIKVNNISQIRQITKSLPQDILKQAVVDEKPVLSYLWNTPVFSNKDGTVMFRYKNTPANFWSSNAWNPETNMFVGNFNEKIRKY